MRLASLSPCRHLIPAVGTDTSRLAFPPGRDEGAELVDGATSRPGSQWPGAPACRNDEARRIAAQKSILRQSSPSRNRDMLFIAHGDHPRLDVNVRVLGGPAFHHLTRWHRRLGSTVRRMNGARRAIPISSSMNGSIRHDCRLTRTVGSPGRSAHPDGRLTRTVGSPVRSAHPYGRLTRKALSLSVASRGTDAEAVPLGFGY